MAKVEEDVDVRHHGIGPRRRAGQLDHHPVDAVQLVNVRATQLDAQQRHRIHQHAIQGEEPGEEHKDRHPLPGHDRVVGQGPADGHVSVVCHQGQHGEVAAGGRVDDETLQHAASVGDDRGGQKVHEELGVEPRRSVQRVDTEAAQEDVHGLMEVPVHHDGTDQKPIGQDDHQIPQQGQDEEIHPLLVCKVEPRESEQHCQRVIFHRTTHKFSSVFTTQLPAATTRQPVTAYQPSISCLPL